MRSLALSVFAAVLVMGLSAQVYAGCGNCEADKAGAEHSHNKAGQCADCAAKASKAGSQAEVGKPAPAFAAVDQAGNTVDLAKLTKQGKIVVLEWFNPDCPFVKAHYEKMSTMKDLAAKYADKNVVWLAVNSSHYADQDANAKWAKKWKIDYPVLNDQSGEIGRTYGAKTTPHMYVIDAKGKLVYAGAIDDNPRPMPRKDGEKTVNYVDQALASLLSEQAISISETKPYGCGVKYNKKAAAASHGDDTLACAPCADCP